ncbi:MAG TPA: 3-oxoadipate enol-lactonase, partial [Methylomirabilota bacterium]|nr:3-oxoadipate enol-lactonase [Methylomirabilota bacterium]
MRQIAIRGGGIAVSTRGPETGPTVVFLNSLGTDLRVWDQVVERLGADLRLVRIDKRGHGLSTLEPASRTVSDHAADVAAVLDALSIQAPLVVGLSIGGLIAQTLAVARPDLASGLLLLDTAHRVGTTESWNARIAAVRGGGLDAIADQVMERWFSARFRETQAEVVAAWRTLLVRMPADGYIAACEALRDADLTELSPKVAVPTRFAVGSADLSTPPDLVRSAAALVPGARFDVIEGAGHLPPIERP